MTGLTCRDRPRCRGGVYAAEEFKSNCHRPCHMVGRRAYVSVIISGPVFNRGGGDIWRITKPPDANSKGANMRSTGELSVKIPKEKWKKDMTNGKLLRAGKKQEQ